MSEYDVVIIGAGPAGMTAAIYASRANLNVLMLEKGAPGGKMVSTYEVENYTGLGKISGAELSMKMFNHTEELGVEYKYGDVVKIVDNKNRKTVITSDAEYSAKAVIVATGTVPRKLGAKNEDKLAGRGISWCAVCDGAFFKNKEVIVIGGGNSAVEEAIYLTSMVSKVTIVNILETLQADQKSITEAKENDKIDILLGYEVTSFNEEGGKLTNVSFKHARTNEELDINAEGTFIFIGHIPETKMVEDFDIRDKYGYIFVNEYMETTVPGIYAVGDVIVKDLRQIITAASDGAIAAQRSAKYIEELVK